MPLDTQACDTIEIARLTNKIPLLSRCLGGLLPGIPQEQVSAMKEVLEIGCGPGAWMQEFARAYNVPVTGIDTRPTMACQATKRLKEAQISNAVALLVDSYAEPLPFEDNRFDLVSIQFLSLLLRADKWVPLLVECKRVLRKGGFIRVTEFELAQSNAPAQEEWWQLCWRALKHLDRCPSLSNRYLGWFSELEPMVSSAGFQDGKCIPHIVNYSYGAPHHHEWKRDLNLQVLAHLPRMLEMGLLTQEQSLSLQQRMEHEMNSPNFHAIQPFLTVLGRKF